MNEKEIARQARIFVNEFGEEPLMIVMNDFTEGNQDLIEETVTLFFTLKEENNLNFLTYKDFIFNQIEKIRNE